MMIIDMSVRATVYVGLYVSGVERNTLYYLWRRKVSYWERNPYYNHLRPFAIRASAYVLINSCIHDLAHLGVRVLSCIGYDLLPRPV